MQRVALRKLELIHAAKGVEDLRIPPGNWLERLSGDRKGQHSIRVNAQWWMCFVCTEERSGRCRTRRLSLTTT
ncbi:MAG: type II toxin-antitoxin system RelE/ParE family toxin [Lacisediminihabitans sp.]